MGLSVVESLRAYWHPVARSAEVGAAPLAARLLDEPLVLWRDTGGAAVAMRDLCIHRGTPLSLGWVDGGRIVCAYHGWRYEADGGCALIPSLLPGRSIPAKARVRAYDTVEQGGVVWVRLDPSDHAPPSMPKELDDPAHRLIGTFDGYYAANAARFIENMLDRSHFPWVHENILGTRDHPEVSDIDIRDIPGGFGYLAEGRTAYELQLPFTLTYRPHLTDKAKWQTISFASCPISSKRLRSFGWVWSNFTEGLSDEEVRARTLTLYEQDRAVVEAQRPEELPLDLTEELHLKGADAAAVEYRRRMRALVGVSWS